MQTLNIGDHSVARLGHHLISKHINTLRQKCLIQHRKLFRLENDSSTRLTSQHI